MQALTFNRGVHPKDEKAITANKPIEVIMPKVKQVFYFPVCQHIGAPCEPIVEKGDYVKVGQKIAEAKAFVSSPIFSSISGTVTDIRPMLVPGGAMMQSIVIENDGLMQEIEGLNEAKDYTKMSNEEILSCIKEAGVVGLGGAGFPTHVKLAPPKDKVIDYILINGAECEPYLTCDYRLMLEEPEKIIKGLQVILKLHPNAKGVIGIEQNKPEAIKVMTEAAKGIDNITVATLITKFPQGSEKHLIYAITKREVKSGALPADAGCIVDNIDTVIAIYNAMFENKPIMRRIITVSGRAVANPGNYEIRIGTTFKDIIDSIGGFKETPAKFIAGGPMMGPAMYTLDVATVKTSSALLCLTEKEAMLPPESNCIRCGKCVSHCPMGLMPLELNQYAIRGDGDGFVKANGLDCIECGSCSFICPAKRHLAQSIRAEKKIQMAKKKK
ncbi:MAG: electron transport complex subunit RsxC [Lachnospiraceae bacterium]|nr:electron transport complex subunit RsxC [Lachnospiraceae bacterium]